MAADQLPAFACCESTQPEGLLVRGLRTDAVTTNGKEGKVLVYCMTGASR
jgi:hypothetical protein